jgi:hypothetical protein
MPDIETKLVQKLLAIPDVVTLIGTRVFPELASQGSDLPRVTYQRISGGPVNASSGPAGGQAGRYQVNCMADSYAEAKELALAVRGSENGTNDGLSGWSDPTGDPAVSSCLLVNEMDDLDMPPVDSEPVVYRVVQDYSIRWA